MRPIDADALKESFEKNGRLTGYIDEVINDAPTIELHKPAQRPLALEEIDEDRPVWLQYRGEPERGAHWRKDGWKPYGTAAKEEARVIRYGTDFRAWKDEPTEQEAGTPWEEPKNEGRGQNGQRESDCIEENGKADS